MSEPAKPYRGSASIFGRTSVSDAAAKTVSRPLDAPAAELAAGRPDATAAATSSAAIGRMPMTRDSST